MGWLDNLWRRRQGDSTETERDTAESRARAREARRPESDKADELEERAHQHRDDEVFREPRLPPGTG